MDPVAVLIASNLRKEISGSELFDGGDRYVARLEKVAAMERGMRDG